MLDLAILNAEAAAGMFTNSIEVLAKEVHHEPLPGEVRAVVIAAWRRGGLLPKEVIDQLVPQTTAGENFCEKWTKHPERARAFFAWHDVMGLPPLRRDASPPPHRVIRVGDLWGQSGSAVANGVRLGRKQTLTYHQRQRQPSALKASKETHGEFGGSYNVSGWTFARLTARLP
jgi:hypothetical protein